MRIVTPAAAVITAAVAAATFGLAGAASAAPLSHQSTARAAWKHGATVDAAEQSRYWLAASKELPTSDVHEREDLKTLVSIPLTGTTASQRATAQRVVRELNGFFQTPGLYGVAAGRPVKIARADWIKSNKVAAAKQSFWLAGAQDELASYGTRYGKARVALRSLGSIPLTSTTAAQRATAHRDVKALDAFFKTPGLGT